MVTRTDLSTDHRKIERDCASNPSTMIHFGLIRSKAQPTKRVRTLEEMAHVK